MSKPLMAPPPSKPHIRRLLPRTTIVLLTTVCFLASVLFAYQNARSTPTPPLTVITMLFGRFNSEQLSDIPRFVSHNCHLISRSRHKYIIFTDNVTHPFCQVCECRLFTPRNCHLTCADPTGAACNHCEKLMLVRDAVFEFKEYAFLDSDLVIANHEFLDKLSFLAQAHDFLASYAFRDNTQRYERNINSGLFFIRWIPTANYSEMMDMMAQMGTNSDQAVISQFVFKYYKNWDSLSRRWHCRLAYVRKTNFPLTQCYTFHGKGHMNATLGKANVQVLPLS